MSDENINIRNLRQDYKSSFLLETAIETDPIKQFDKWFKHALDVKILEPNAMTLATVDSSGFPNARIVLLKEFNENGFVFFTNYNSAKGQNISFNPNVSLLFFWVELERQVRIYGTAEKLTEKDSEDYFHSRPHGSQLGAHASPQSQVIPNREFLEKELKNLELEYNQKEIPKPLHWGGYLVKPVKIEFWQGRSNRLHDRILYTKNADASWQIERLAP